MLTQLYIEALLTEDVCVTAQIPVIYQSDEGFVCVPMGWRIIPPPRKNSDFSADLVIARCPLLSPPS